jgi:hypothetical protein
MMHVMPEMTHVMHVGVSLIFIDVVFINVRLREEFGFRCGNITVA